MKSNGKIIEASSQASRCDTGDNMSVRSLAEIMEEMRKCYKQHPKLQKKWQVLAGGDEYGYSDLFFYGPGVGVWQIKGELKSPYEMVGAGARVAARKVDDEIRDLMGQGLPMPFGLISPHPQFKDRAIIAAGIGRHQESTERLRGLLPGRQRKVDLELKRKLDELRRKFELDVAYR